MVKVMSLLIKSESALGFSFGVRAQAEREIWCVKCVCTCMLKVASYEIYIYITYIIICVAKTFNGLLNVT